MHLFNMEKIPSENPLQQSARKAVQQWIVQAYHLIGDFERKIHRERSFMARLLLLPLLFGLYVLLLGCLLFMVLFVPSAELFVYIYDTSPTNGYDFSYADFQRRRFIIQVLLFVGVILFFAALYYFFLIPALGIDYTF